MIAGIRLHCEVGPFVIGRSPLIKLFFRRRDVLSRCEILMRDPAGEVRGSLAKRQRVFLSFGHRGGDGATQEWEGKVKDFILASTDVVHVSCVGLEQALIDARVTLAMHGEPSDVAGKRLLATSGLPVAEVAIPSEIFPHMVFSNVSVARALKQLSLTLENSYGHDLSKHAVWLGKSGLHWSAGSEPGDIPVVETARNLISNSPNPNGMRYAVATLLPGLTASRMFRIRDMRTGQDEVLRAQEVTHVLS